MDGWMKNICLIESKWATAPGKQAVESNNQVNMGAICVGGLRASTWSVRMCVYNHVCVHVNLHACAYVCRFSHLFTGTFSKLKMQKSV